jgi:hypothetical protein
MKLSKENVREIIEARLQRESYILAEAHLPPTDDVLQKAKEDLDALREKLPSMTQILVADAVTLEMEALAKAIGFKGMGRMRAASNKLKGLGLEYKSEAYELASIIAELAASLREQTDSGLKDLEKRKTDRKKEAKEKHSKKKS